MLNVKNFNEFHTVFTTLNILDKINKNDIINSLLDYFYYYAVKVSYFNDNIIIYENDIDVGKIYVKNNSIKCSAEKMAINIFINEYIINKEHNIIKRNKKLKNKITQSKKELIFDNSDIHLLFDILSKIDELFNIMKAEKNLVL